MVTSNDCLKKWGDPAIVSNELKYMTVWDVPTHLEIGVLPKKLYCNKIMVEPLSKAFANLIDRGLVKDLKTFDGCFNVRKKVGLKSLSLHSWGIAVDINAAWNGLNRTPTMSKEMVKCFTDVGFDWGGNWTRKDGMHFQLSSLS
tara:strand:+ start:115 stop:546 length:432 start_codon:yes stop_codon:yes gene_type:complete